MKVVCTQDIAKDDAVVVVNGMARPTFEGETKLATYTALEGAAKGQVAIIDLSNRTFKKAPKGT